MLFPIAVPLHLSGSTQHGNIMTPFRNAFILLLFIFFIGAAACKKDSSAPVFTLRIMGKYGNQSFTPNVPNTDAAGRYISFSLIRFYLSHINLIKSNGSLVNVAPVALFDLSDTALFSVSANNIQGSFTGISFVCGLDSLANDTTDPYTNQGPLSGAYDMYWPMIKYQFETMQGKWDTANTASYPYGLLYHIGTNAAYRQTQLNQSISVSGNSTTLTLYLDIAQIFNNTATGETINIVTEPTSSSSLADNPAILPAFADNFSHAFTFAGP